MLEVNIGMKTALTASLEGLCHHILLPVIRAKSLFCRAARRRLAETLQSVRRAAIDHLVRLEPRPWKDEKLMSRHMPKHVAVFGALRSGTTLLRLMLDQHAHLACPGETDYLFDHVIGGDAGVPVFDREAMADDRIYRVFCEQFGLTPEDPQTLESLIRVMRGPTKDPEATVVLMLHRNLDIALQHLPDMKILHLVRDPRDVARSSIGMGWAGSTYYGVHHWLKTEREWAALVPKLAQEQVLQVNYETLIEAPEETLTAICDFFGVAFTPEMLAYDSDSTYAKPDPSLTYQWRSKQSARDVGLVEAQVGDLLETLDYTPSGFPAVVPGALERLHLKLEQIRTTWTVRIRRHGLRDPVVEMISRRLGWPALGRDARRRIDKGKEHYLK